MNRKCKGVTNWPLATYLPYLRYFLELCSNFACLFSKMDLPRGFWIDFYIPTMSINIMFKIFLIWKLSNTWLARISCFSLRALMAGTGPKENGSELDTSRFEIKDWHQWTSIINKTKKWIFLPRYVRIACVLGACTSERTDVYFITYHEAIHSYICCVFFRLQQTRLFCGAVTSWQRLLTVVCLSCYFWHIFVTQKHHTASNSTDFTEIACGFWQRE